MSYEFRPRVFGLLHISCGTGAVGRVCQTHSELGSEMPCRRSVRLDAARAELLEPSESTTVTSVALANGFFHLARFSAYYRAPP
jgi:hypothetical protein